MNEFKGTPGPWEIKPEEVDRPYIRIRGTRLGGRFKVANVLSPDYDGVHHREADETRANARLIASSPQLLELLIKCADALDEVSYQAWRGEIIDEARAVIAKALGEPQ